MFDIANITVMGRISTEPEERKTKDGDSYATFNVACNVSKELANFYSIICFGKLAEYALQNIKPGIRCTCIGSLKMEIFEKDNTVKYRLAVKADVIFPGILSKTKESDEEEKDINNDDEYY